MSKSGISDFFLLMLKFCLVLIVSPFLSGKTLGSVISLNVVSRVVPWVCSVQQTMSSYCAMTVSPTSVTFDYYIDIPAEFGVYVDKHGDPSRSTGTIEWEGTAERVALHHPYILLFDPRFIEVRQIETGRLAQIIPGNDVRCIWDGRGVSSNRLTFANAGQDMGQENQVHAVMTNPDQGPISGPRTKAIAQCVFELVPTVPLYPPVPINTNGSLPPAPAGGHPSHYVSSPNSRRS